MTNQLRKKRLANQLTQQINRNIEAKLQANLQNFFETLKQKVLVAFDEYYNDTFLLQGHVDLILAPIHEAEQEYYELLLNANREMYNRGKQQGERLVSNAHRNSMKAKKKTVDFLHDKDKPLELFGTIQSSEEYLEQYTFTATEKTMSRVDGEINKILTDGYKEGWGVKDVRNRIMERYGQFSSWEANRIARTEMQTAHNMGVMQSFQELGVEYKEWRSAHDSRVRTSHIYMDGEIAPLDEPFSNGLMYPGDKSGRIEEWINCRCSMVPYLMPPGSVAPVGRGTFRASDLVSVSEPDYGRLLKEHTGGQLNWQQYKQVLHGKPVNMGVGATVQATQTTEEPTLAFEELQTNEQIAEHYGLKYEYRKSDKTIRFTDEKHGCELIFDKSYTTGKHSSLIDGTGNYHMRDVVRYYMESPSLLKYATNELTFVNSRAKRTLGTAHVVEYTKTRAKLGEINKDIKVKRTKFIKINPIAFNHGKMDKANLRMTILHEMSHCLDFSYTSAKQVEILINPDKYLTNKVRSTNKDIEYYWGISGIDNRVGKKNPSREDVKHQRENNLPISPHASKYGGKNSAENWAETGAMSSFYQIEDKAMAIRDDVLFDEWIKRHPNKYQRAVDIFENWKPSDFTLR